MPKAIKIRTDYVPKAKQNIALVKTAQLQKPTQICPRCNQAIPADEMQQHLKIELIDPRWKDQKKRFLDKRKGTNMIDSGDAIAANIKRFAEFRADIFGGDIQETERKLQQEKAQVIAKTGKIWDGSARSADAVASRASLTVSQQIAAMEASIEKRKRTEIGPKIPFIESKEEIELAKLKSAYSDSRRQ